MEGSTFIYLTTANTVDRLHQLNETTTWTTLHNTLISLSSTEHQSETCTSDFPGDVFNTSITTQSSNAFQSGLRHKWVTLLVAMLCLLGISLNGLTLLVIVRGRRQLRSMANILVLHICLCDLFSCIIPAPLLVYALIKGRWPLGDTGCKVHGFSLLLLQVLSIISLTSLSIER